jgi:hypothetical protein
MEALRLFKDEHPERVLQSRGRAGRDASITRMRLRLLASSWPRAMSAHRDLARRGCLNGVSLGTK